ncbi:MAG: Ig-like domain-containing protein [Patescibacteria group bacterium]|jgi:hypothetical protein
MPVYLLNLFFRFSGFTFRLKQKIVAANNWLIAIPYAFLLVIFELGLMIISLPVYLLVSPAKIQEEGFIFPRAVKDAVPAGDYALRRKITLATLFGAAGIFLLKILFVGVVSFYFFGAQRLLADTQDWTFSAPSDYTYDSGRIEITGGVAQLKNLGGTVTGSSTNPGFIGNANGWTYADWSQPGKTAASGAYVSTGGTPDGHVEITLRTTSATKNQIIAGFYEQAFVTSVASPDTATLSLDWNSITYTSPNAPITYRVYAFVDTASGVPSSTSTAVWSSAEIRSASVWASSTTINITGKIPAAGTYYLKFAAYVVLPNNSANYNYVSGFDNVALNWSKVTESYDTGKATTTPLVSLSVPKAVSWNSFIETATKNGGEIYYQLTADDGANWQYYNGSAWATTTSITDYNTASTTNAYLSYFATSSNRIKWRAYLSSNGTQPVILDNVSIAYTQNQRPAVANLAPEQNSNYGYVHVNYDLQDAESDPSGLSTYEYSLTGAFSGEQAAMTASTTDPAHSGISSLTAAPAGVAHTFVWDAKSQLGDTYYANVYVRLRPNDGIGDGGYATSTAFAVDYATSTISNVTAVQNSGSTTVAIAYDLFDDTVDNILVEMQISGDGGSTWEVATTSAIGAVGAGVSAGNGKAITWNAGADYPNQQKSNLRIRLRAKDKFQNQGDYASSSAFSLDTLAPAINITANIFAQPNAGDTVALIGGAFVEANPNSNDFYITIDSGAYGSSTPGDINTATPSNQNTAVGATLDGNDYISQVKIVHVDDYGLSVINENTSPNLSYKYVKPYTPPAPTLSDPVTVRLDLLINPYAGEASNLEYEIFEISTAKYVQADGTLGDNPVWQPRGTASGEWGSGLGVIGKIRVIGLISPVSSYSFKVKSRNPSDSAQAASSESAWSAAAAIPNTAPVLALNGQSQTADGSQYVNINYTGTDGQGDLNYIANYQYSTDNSAWQAMTEKSDVGSNGVSSLIFLPTGSDYKFSWNSGLDLSGVEDSSVYIRMKANDTQIDGNQAISSVFEIDNVAPVVSAVSAGQNAGAKTVAIAYNLADANNSAIQIDISADGGATWNVATSSLSGAVGLGVVPGSKTASWNASADFNGQYNTQMKVRLRARDSFGNLGAYVESAAFDVDTHAPVLSNITAAQDTGADTFTFHYDVTEDIGNVAITLTISSDDGLTWIVPVASAAGAVGVSIEPGATKTITWNAAADYDNQEKSAMRIRLTASDSFTNSGNLDSSGFSLDSQAPRITNVVGVQALGSTDVFFHYDLADAHNSDIALDISSDSGLSWTVADTSVTGAVGAEVSQGVGQTINWNAADDFLGHDLSVMRVRLRGTDIYNNASSDISSADFSLDTLAPAVNVAADLLAQPNAGATAALIGGSFIETHPNTNDFYVAIDGGIYSSATAGSSNSASPADQLTAIGATLDGNDYISKVKIVHVDDYGQSVANEEVSLNSSYKYVKPYAPPAPAVDNPGIGTVDVRIDKNAAETDGLEYAIFEASTTKYVQADGMLGNSPVWQTLGTGLGQWGQASGVAGMINVDGLTTHSYLYRFQVKSRNTSDAAHSVSSESALSSSASSANQSPMITINSVGQTSDGSRYVTISYIGSDLESENTTLVAYQYSTDNSTWHSMTEKLGVGSDGQTGLSFAYSGTAHDFMWDVAADLANTEDSTTYIRLQANDGTSDGGLAASSAFVIDTKNPSLASVSASQISDSNIVMISYDLFDLSDSAIELQISFDAGATWTVATSTANGDVGLGVVPDSGKIINWNPGVDYSGQEDNDLRARVRAVDAFGNSGSFVSSGNFSVDTKSPVFANISAVQSAGTNTVRIAYDISDANNSEVALDISADGGTTWSVPDASVTGDVGSGIIPGNDKVITWNAGNDFSGHDIFNMRVRLRAVDTHNNATGDVESADFSLDTLAPSISNVTAGQALSSDNVGFGYNLADSDNVWIILDISADNGLTWNVATSTLAGDVGSGIIPGNNKSITWDAAVNYNGHQNDAMKVRVRGLDSFNNVSANVELPGSFSLDTLAPVKNATADLKAQPNAGDTAVLIGGSFTEVNPNINDFLVAINGGADSATTTGEVGTADPIDQNTVVGAMLTGNDYVSKVRLVNLDDYGHWGVNENISPNSSYKYVKPYTPPAPIVDNPQNNNADLAIAAHAGESASVEYAVYEVSTGKYLQADGSLGAGAVWKTLGTASGEWGNLSGVAGKVNIIGLVSPVASYSFITKSRNPRDASQAASSESSYSPVAGISNTAPHIIITSASQSLSGNYVVINYTGADAQNDTNNLTAYEYSTNGSTWQVMTEKLGVGSDGTSTLVFSSDATAYNFAWDVSYDLPNQEQGAVYVRLLSSDGLVSSNLAASSAFYVDTRGPIISNLSMAQAPASNIITFGYDLNDSSGADNIISLEISDDSGATYAVATTTLAGDIGLSVTAGDDRTVTWDAGTDFVGQESSIMKIRIRGLDRYGNLGNYAVSDNFTVDAKAPIVSGVAASQVSGSDNVSINYVLDDNTPAGHLVEFLISSDGGATWTVATTTRSGDIGSGQTVGTKNFVWSAGIDFSGHDLSVMRAQVRAKDYFGHQGAYAASANFSLDTLAPVILNISAHQALGTTTVAIVYDLDENAVTTLDISSDGGATWTVAKTSLAGDLGVVTAGNDKLISWNASTDFGGQENSIMRVRLNGRDSFGNLSSYYESSDFVIDTAAPLGLISLNKFSATSSSATLNWQASADAHFNHYELWHGANLADVNNHAGSAHQWSVADDVSLSDSLAISTVIAGVDLADDYYVKIWAVDDFGNSMTVPAINIYETPVVPPAPTVTVSGALGGAAIIADTFPPAKPILNPLNTPTRDASINISGLAEPRSKVELYDNGALLGTLRSLADNNGTFSQDFRFVSGHHSLTIRALDSSNNASEFSDAVVLNIITTSPTLPIILTPANEASIVSATPLIVGVADANNRIDIKVDNDQFTVASDSSGAWSFILPSTFALRDGRHTISVIARDAAGNESAPAVSVITKITIITPSPISSPISVTGPGPSSVSSPSPEITSLPSTVLISQTTEATELPGIPVPKVMATGASVAAAGDVLSFTGTSLPNFDVVVYIHSDQALVYRAHTDALGNWRINHSQAVSELAPGNHTIYAVALDADAKVKSRPSAVNNFTVQRNFWVMAFKYLDWRTTAVALAILILAILWLYRIRSKKKS